MLRMPLPRCCCAPACHFLRARFVCALRAMLAESWRELFCFRLTHCSYHVEGDDNHAAKSIHCWSWNGSRVRGVALARNASCVSCRHRRCGDVGAGGMRLVGCPAQFRQEPYRRKDRRLNRSSSA